ncbi:MAG: PEP-CTERM sorting domain-containing protein, partial [Planctomycetales bacterium]|nr:PEP-CTERM sorting domain-containing protein [Planctomycetales bacterium]
VSEWGWLNVEWDPDLTRPSWFVDVEQWVIDRGLDQYPAFQNEAFQNMETDTDIDLYIEGGFNRGMLVGSLYVTEGEIGEWVLVPEPAVSTMGLTAVLAMFGWIRRRRQELFEH